MRRNVLKRVITAVALSVAMLSQAMVAPAAEAKTFEDVSAKAWYATPVNFCVENGYFHGMTDTTFGPSVKLSRAMMVTTLWNMAGNPAPEKTTNFPDVKTSNWFYKAVQWAAGVGIVSGNADGTFAPSRNISRQEVAVMLKNFAKVEGKDIEARADISGYADTKSVASYAKAPIAWAVNYKIISGKENGTKIDPKGDATRAEAASMLMNYCKNVKSNASWENTVYDQIVQYVISNGRIQYVGDADGTSTDTIRSYIYLVSSYVEMSAFGNVALIYDPLEKSLQVVDIAQYFDGIFSRKETRGIVLYENDPLKSYYSFEYSSSLSTETGERRQNASATYSCKTTDVKKNDTPALAYTEDSDYVFSADSFEKTNQAAASALETLGYTMADLGFTAY